MKRMIYMLMLLLLSCTTVFAQPRGKHGERVKDIKIGYITDRIHLTSDQATKFWPVYNQYEQEVRSTRRSFFEQYRGKNNSHDEETARRYVEDNLEYQEAELRLKRKYKNELLKVISAQQLADLYVAEREFRKMLVNELRERRGNGHGGGPKGKRR